MMALTVEVCHQGLVEVGLPSTIADVKNPTEQYILDLITQFFGKFYADVSAIRKPTIEQLNLMLAQDNPETLGLVNLTAAMASVARAIFMNDFHLTDITSPVPKRSRRQARFMTNFLVYATGKKVEIEETLEASRLKNSRLQEIRNQRMAVREATNAEALRIAKNFELEKQLESEIANMKIGKNKRRAKKNEAELKLSTAEKEKMEAEQRYVNLTAHATQIRQTMNDTKLKVVKSPDRHNALWHSLTEQKNEIIEKRTVMEEALKKKKPAIEHTEIGMNFVRQEHAKFSEVIEICKRFAENKKVFESGQKKISVLKGLIDQESKAGAAERDRFNTEMGKQLRTQWKEQQDILIKERKELSEEKKKLEKMYEDWKISLQEMLSKKIVIENLIAKKKIDSEKFINDCRELYEAEIKKEQDMSESVEKTLEGLKE